MSDTVSQSIYAQTGFTTGTTSRFQSQSLFGAHMQDALQADNAPGQVQGGSSLDPGSNPAAVPTADPAGSTAAAPGSAAGAAAPPRISPMSMRQAVMREPTASATGAVNGPSQTGEASSSSVNNRVAQSPSSVKQPELARSNAMDAETQSPNPDDAAAVIADAGSAMLPLAAGSTRASAIDAKSEVASRHKHSPGSDDTPHAGSEQAIPTTAIAGSASVPVAIQDIKPRSNDTATASDQDDRPGGSAVSGGSLHGTQAGTTAAGHVEQKAGSQNESQTQATSADAAAPAPVSASPPTALPTQMPSSDMQMQAGIAAPVAQVSGTSTAAEAGRTEPGTSDTPMAQLAGPVVTLAQGGNKSSSMSVSLHPKDLGEVTVRLDRDMTGAVRIVVAATEPATLRSLMAEQSHLHAALDAASLPTADRQFSFELTASASAAGTDSQTAQAGTGDGERRRNDQGQPQDRGASDPGRVAGEDRTSSPPAFVTGRVNAYRAGINITA